MANANPVPNKRGRPKGVPNKLTTSIKEAFKQAFDQRGGVDSLLEWAEKEPTAFYNLVGRLIPTEVVGQLDVTLLTVEERKARLAELLKEAAARG
jgi:hypothetical protein